MFSIREPCLHHLLYVLISLLPFFSSTNAALGRYKGTVSFLFPTSFLNISHHSLRVRIVFIPCNHGACVPLQHGRQGHGYILGVPQGLVYTDAQDFLHSSGHARTRLSSRHAHPRAARRARHLSVRHSPSRREDLVSYRENAASSCLTRTLLGIHTANTVIITTIVLGCVTHPLFIEQSLCFLSNSVKISGFNSV